MANRTIFVSSLKDKVIALRASDGSRRWIFRADGPVEASPAVAGSAVYFGSGNRVHSVSAATGASCWSQTVGIGIDSGAAVDDGRVFIARGDEIYALNAADGQRAWSYIIGIPVDTAPVAAGNLIYMGADAVDAFNARKQIMQRGSREVGPMAGANCGVTAGPAIAG